MARKDENVVVTVTEQRGGLFRGARQTMVKARLDSRGNVVGTETYERGRVSNGCDRFSAFYDEEWGSWQRARQHTAFHRN